MDVQPLLTPQPYRFTAVPLSFLPSQAQLFLATLTLSASTRPIHISEQRLLLAHELAERLLENNLDLMKWCLPVDNPTNDPIWQKHLLMARCCDTVEAHRPGRIEIVEDIALKLDTLVWLESHYLSLQNKAPVVPDASVLGEDQKYRDTLIAPYITYAEQTTETLKTIISQGPLRILEGSYEDRNEVRDAVGREIEGERQHMMQRIRVIPARTGLEVSGLGDDL